MESAAEGEQLNRIVEVTGASLEEAQHLLAACANNVEAAVELYFEQGGDVTPAIAALNSNNLPPSQQIGEEEEVRAPIAPIRETLVGPHDDNFIAPPSARLARLSQRVKVCPLRDFAREGALMEEALEKAVLRSSTTPSPFAENMARAARAAQMVEIAQQDPKKTATSRLGDLFRPPTDIAYSGTFASSRDRATELRQWLLVNVQSDNFDSQLLNRDVWSDRAVRRVLRRQFLLWQVDNESLEGHRFVTFYHCAKLPYVCIIDPRTGEEMFKSTDTKQDKLLDDLLRFIRDHRDFIDDDTPSTSKRSLETIAIDDDDEDIQFLKVENKNGIESSPVASTSSAALLANSPLAKKRSKLLDLSEEEQVALAIRNSMQENGKNGLRRHQNDSDDSDDDDDDVDDSNAINKHNHGTSNGNNNKNGRLEDIVEERKEAETANESYEQYLGELKDELTMIKLRLLNADGADETVQLRWPSDTRLYTIRMYIDEKHEHLQKGDKGYKLICAFPRKPLESEHDLSTLKELGLHPSANLHVTLEE